MAVNKHVRTSIGLRCLFTKLNAVLSNSGSTALKAGRSRVRFPIMSLEFFIDIIRLTAQWMWSRLSF